MGTSRRWNRASPTRRAQARPAAQTCRGAEEVGILPLSYIFLREVIEIIIIMHFRAWLAKDILHLFRRLSW